MNGFFDFNNNGKTDMFDIFVTSEIMGDDNGDADKWDDDEDEGDEYEDGFM